MAPFLTTIWVQLEEIPWPSGQVSVKSPRPAPVILDDLFESDQITFTSKGNRTRFPKWTLGPMSRTRAFSFSTFDLQSDLRFFG